ncbi:MAG: DUF499 domain-containing protein [Gemmatales bacterium]|nr:DUF499 domain-containing protein [Gemmatales bacterium]
MKPWIQVITPHKDIRTGRLDEGVYAADLSDVVGDRGPLEYRDPQSFFRKTYLTQGLVKLLSLVLGRLAGQNAGEAVIQIQTPFGGGKTHSLIALYHMIRSGNELGDVSREILAKAGLTAVPQAQVVTFVGTAADALGGRTPWGELAWQLGRYDVLREHDQKRRAPGKNLLFQLLGTQPTLILMDEIAEYAVKARDFRDQLVAFCQELTETVKVLSHCVLVVTLPSSAPYGEEGERALHELQKVFGRVENIQTPVEGEEIYEVIRRRLFEDSGDAQEIRRTADEFFQMYQELGEDVPKEVRERPYRDRIRRAYPFHPELIEVLFERWSTYPSFQRTRGVLRLLALVVSDLYRSHHQAPLILPAHLNLADSAIRGEFLRHVGNEYQGVIASDISDNGQAKSERIDQEMGSEYASYNVARGLARAIFFASFSGGERRGVGIQRLRLSLLQPGLPPAIVSDALRRLEEELWYLHVEGGVYLFSSQPNLNRVIVEKEEAIRPEDITLEIQKRLDKLAGKEFRVFLWPREWQDIPDDTELKLVLLGPEYTFPSEETKAFVRELFNKCGQSFRTYRNTLFVLAADESEWASARQKVKRYLAYRGIREDKTLWRQLSEANQQTLETKIRDADDSIAHPLMSAYRHLAKAHESEIVWLDLGLPTREKDYSLARRVREYLQNEDILLNKISPRYILEKAMAPHETQKRVDEIYEAFLRYPSLPVLASKQVLLDALAQGVREGILQVQMDDRIVSGEELPPSELKSDAVVLREAEVAPQRPVQLKEFVPTQMPPHKVGGPPVQAPPASAGVATEYNLEVNLPWDKISDFVRGVVKPLHEGGAEVAIRIALTARSEEGINPATLERTVRETLRQIGAQILKDTLLPPYDAK